MIPVAITGESYGWIALAIGFAAALVVAALLIALLLHTGRIRRSVDSLLETAGAVAANTTLPVIGVPLSGGALDGVDALYSTVQMPRGIPVATVAVNGSMNAALLAVQMLAISEPTLAARLADHRRGLATA